MKIELREGHKYFVDGYPVPGVNEILMAGGFTPDFSAVNSNLMDRAQAFGKAVHKAIALFTVGILNMEALDAALKPYLASWQEWVRMTGFKPLCCEKRLYSKKWGFAGTPDQPGKIGSKYILPDYKSSTTLSPAVDLQLAGYEILMREEFNIKDNQKVERIAIKLCPDGRPRPKPCKEISDRVAFLSALYSYKWKKRNRLIVAREELFV